MSAQNNPLPGQRLDSWKEIAAFLGRSERTVKRWETDRGLPVHRVPGSGRAAIFAYREELAEWLEGSPDLERRWPSTREEVRRFAVPAAPFEISQARVARPSLRLVPWLVPLVLVTIFLVYLSVGHRGMTFKAAASRHEPNSEAQDLYLKGRYFWNRRTPEDLNKAVDYFTQSIVKDPSNATSYVGLADCYNLLREFGAMPPDEAYPRALAAAQRAVELDDTSAEAHASLGFVTFWWSWRAATAEHEFKRALELNPDFGRAHHWYATFLLAMHRHQEALDQMDWAQRLDPSSPAILADKGLLLWRAGREHEALALLRQLEASDPLLSSTHDYLGRILWEQKDFPGAFAEWRRAAQLRKDGMGLALANARESGFASSGLRGMWEKELPLLRQSVKQHSGSFYDLADAAAALGRKQESLQALQAAFDDREAAMLVGEPDLPNLHDDPAYQQLRASVKKLLLQ